MTIKTALDKWAEQALKGMPEDLKVFFIQKCVKYKGSTLIFCL